LELIFALFFLSENEYIYFFCYSAISKNNSINRKIIELRRIVLKKKKKKKKKKRKEEEEEKQEEEEELH